MNARKGGTAGTARGAARLLPWALAYALVLQVLLAGVALAGMVRAPADPGLCLGAIQSGGGDGAALPLVHCPACLAAVDAAVLPPPFPTPVIDRIAIALVFRIEARDALAGPGIRLPVQPRAPPVSA